MRMVTFSAANSGFYSLSSVCCLGFQWVVNSAFWEDFHQVPQCWAGTYLFRMKEQLMPGFGIILAKSTRVRGNGCFLDVCVSRPSSGHDPALCRSWINDIMLEKPTNSTTRSRAWWSTTKPWWNKQKETHPEHPLLGNPGATTLNLGTNWERHQKAHCDSSQHFSAMKSQSAIFTSMSMKTFVLWGKKNDPEIFIHA